MVMVCQRDSTSVADYLNPVYGEGKIHSADRWMDNDELETVEHGAKTIGAGCGISHRTLHSA